MAARIQISYILSRCAAAEKYSADDLGQSHQHCASAAAHLDRKKLILRQCIVCAIYIIYYTYSGVSLKKGAAFRKCPLIEVSLYILL